jgi:hypothetical protein
MRNTKTGLLSIAAAIATTTILGSTASAITFNSSLGGGSFNWIGSRIALTNPGHSAMNDAQVRAIYQTQLEVYAIQRTLSQRIMNSTEIIEARREVRQAYRDYHNAREDALVPLRGTEYYKSLQGQLWKGDTVVTTLHGYVPPDQRKIYDRSIDNLELRKLITNVEQGVLEADEQVLQTRVELNGALRRYLAVLQAAANAVRNDPQMVEASQRLRSLRGAASGR